ncbi:MAG: glycosyltransferase family 2 protein [Anaerolineaceae bacterium]
MLPTVSVIIPCLNEGKTIHHLLDALLAQTYPHDLLEVVIADGFSIDDTRKVIADFSQVNPDLRISIIDNPKRHIPSGLNLAISSATGEYLVRLDAHSIPRPDYIARCIQAHLEGVAENVGGVWDIQPQNNSLIARSIATAAMHPLGVGDAKYRYTDKAEYVDTVPFGSFNKAYLEKIGGFDETLLTNEDYELNTRIRQSGGRVWLDPQIRTVYFARRNLKDLVLQYWRYGFWKAEMIRRYPKTLRLRQALPPLFVAGLVLLFLVGFFFRPALWAMLGFLGVYLLILIMVGIQVAINKKDILMVFGVPLAIAAMQLTWGTGFLVGLVTKKKG